MFQAFMNRLKFDFENYLLICSIKQVLNKSEDKLLFIQF